MLESKSISEHVVPTIKIYYIVVFAFTVPVYVRVCIHVCIYILTAKTMTSSFNNKTNTTKLISIYRISRNFGGTNIWRFVQ